MKPLRRNPQDSTLRNVRAATKRLTALERRVAAIERRLARIAKAEREASA